MKDYILLFAKGLSMGIANAIPGVSGGTIALITGIYEEFLNSLKSFDTEAIGFLKRGKFKELWAHVNGTFLLVLIIGIVSSIIPLATIITFILTNYPIPIWSFFFGLIMISFFSVIKEIKTWNLASFFSLVAGIAVAYYLTLVSPVDTPTDLWFIFLAGMLAISAMMLPGISGAVILLILGKYEYIITSLKDLNIPVILTFMIGCIMGVLSFSKLISWMLKNFHGPAIALLSGFMIGSLNKIWPWKETISFRLNSQGVQVPLLEKSILPGNYFERTGQDPHLYEAILFMAVGILIVVGIEKIATMNQTKLT